MFTKNNLHVVKYIYPNEPLDSPKFRMAHIEVDQRLRKEINVNQKQVRLSVDKYDEILAGQDTDAKLFSRLKNEITSRSMRSTPSQSSLAAAGPDTPQSQEQTSSFESDTLAVSTTPLKPLKSEAKTLSGPSPPAKQRRPSVSDGYTSDVTQ